MKLTPIIANDIENILTSNADISKFRNKRIMITGATGYIGSYLIHTLLIDAERNNAHTVVYAIVRSVERANVMFGKYEESGLIKYICQDVRETISFEEDVDYLIHCASNAAPKEYAEDPVGTMTTNFAGTQNLLEYARTHVTKKFLYVSTIEVYGAFKEKKEPIKEDEFGIMDSCNPRSCYPLSKKACETMCISYGKQYGVPVSIGRLSYIYGPGMKENDSKIAAVFPYNVAHNTDIVMKSEGLQKRSYCYVTDAVSGLLTILAEGNTQEAYNVASKLSITTIRNYAERTVALFSDKKLKVKFDLPDDNEKKAFTFIADAVLDTTRLESLGWKPLTCLDEGLTHTVENYEYIAKETEI